MTFTKCRIIATYNDKRHSAMYGDGCQGKVTDMYKSWFCFGIMCGKPLFHIAEKETVRTPEA